MTNKQSKGDEGMSERHKLDDKLDEVLQHYGVKGMRWDVIRTPEQIAAANGQSTSQQPGGAGGESSSDDDDSFLENATESFGKAIKALDKKLDSIGDSVKKKGMSLLKGLFGKSKVTIKEVRDSKSAGKMKRNEKMEKAMKKYMKSSKAEQSRLKRGIRGSAVVTKVSNPRKRNTSSDSDDLKLQKRIRVARKNNSLNDTRLSNKSKPKSKPMSSSDELKLQKRIRVARKNNALNDTRRSRNN